MEKEIRLVRLDDDSIERILGRELLLLALIGLGRDIAQDREDRALDGLADSLEGHIVYNLTLDESFQVPHRNPHQPDTGFFRGPGDMRRNEAVLRRQQGVGILGRLGRKHVQSGSRYHTLVQCVGLSLIHI